jgi:hypothetical protein
MREKTVVPAQARDPAARFNQGVQRHKDMKPVHPVKTQAHRAEPELRERTFSETFI